MSNSTWDNLYNVIGSYTRLKADIFMKAIISIDKIINRFEDKHII